MRFEERKKNGNVDVDQKRKAEQSSTAPNSLLDLARMFMFLRPKVLSSTICLFFSGVQKEEKEREHREVSFFVFRQCSLFATNHRASDGSLKEEEYQTNEKTSP